MPVPLSLLHLTLGILGTTMAPCFEWSPSCCLRVFWTLAAELCSDRKQHNYSLKLEGNCEHLQSAFLFNTCLECLSERAGKASRMRRAVGCCWIGIAGFCLLVREGFLFRHSHGDLNQSRGDTWPLSGASQFAEGYRGWLGMQSCSGESSREKP